MSGVRSAVRDILTEEFLRLLAALPPVLALPAEHPQRREWVARKERLTEALEAVSLGGAQ